MRIALASMNQEWEDKKANFDKCRLLCSIAKSEGADIVVFPEMTLTGFSMNVKATAERRECSETISLFKTLAQELSIALIAGVTFWEVDKASNNAFFVDGEGEIKELYTKIHPFSFAGEDKVFNGGDKLCVVDFGSLSLGITICYDLRFPELFGALGRKCNLIINIANWPEKRISHWHALLKARAIENQVFMAGVNRIGVDGCGSVYVKSSEVIDADGVNLVPIFSCGELDIFDVCKKSLTEFRLHFSTTQDRRSELYKHFL